MRGNLVAQTAGLRRAELGDDLFSLPNRHGKPVASTDSAGRVIEDHQAVPALCREIHRVIAPASVLTWTSTIAWVYLAER
jgi:hypothetical protein